MSCVLPISCFCYNAYYLSFLSWHFGMDKIFYRTTRMKLIPIGSQKNSRTMVGKKHFFFCSIFSFPVDILQDFHLICSILQRIGLLNKNVAITSLSGKPLKLVNQFIYLSSNILSTESDVQTHIGKAWTAIDWLRNLSSLEILPSCSHVSTTVWLHHLEVKETFRDKAHRKKHEDVACCIEQILEVAYYKRAVI